MLLFHYIWLAGAFHLTFHFVAVFIFIFGFRLSFFFVFHFALLWLLLQGVDLLLLPA